ncbi:glycosyltransferase family 10 [Vibrio splendidus]
MKKISYVSTTFKNNECFELKSKHNRDSFLNFLVRLREELRIKGFSLDTDDISSPSNSDISLHANIRKDFKENLTDYNILIIFESEAILPENFVIENHKYFDVIFTWSEYLLSMDPGKYKYINYSHDIDMSEINAITDIPPRNRSRKLMISGNKKCEYHDELYTEREKVINWYIRNNKFDFDLYGIRWDVRLLSPNSITRKINSFNLRYKFLRQKLPVYKGSADSKFELYKKYKFAYCFENAKNIDGYITEKIFDCMRCGIVPIYFGAESVKSSIPEGCYINYSAFKSIYDVDEYLNNMTDSQYEDMQSNMVAFFKSKKYRKFSSEYFSEQIIKYLSK